MGIYGDCKEEGLTEKRVPGYDFLARVCQEWEKEGLKAKKQPQKNLQIQDFILNFQM